MNVKEIMWNYLINNGMIITDESYYGNSKDREKSIHFKEAHARGNLFINWEETSSVKDDNRREFNGTFCEYDDHINYMYGTLVLLNGEEYLYQLDLDDTHSTTEMINMILGDL